LQYRLLLALYGLGTGAGLKRVGMGHNGVSYRDLLYIRRRFIPTASFNSLPNVLVRKSAVTARSWLTSGTLRWSWTPRPPSPQVLELLVVKLRSENNYLLQKLFL